MARETEIIYGIHAVRHALQQRPESLLELWILEGRGTHESQQIVRLAGQAGVSIQYASKPTLERLATGAVHQGVVARVRSTSNGRVATDIDDILDYAERTMKQMNVVRRVVRGCLVSSVWFLVGVYDDQ